jgi:non-ribosomal peptide synthetase component F
VTNLTDFTSYADAQRHYSTAALWELFDGTPLAINIANECVDRHAHDPARIAVRVAHADGRDEVRTFRDLSLWSSRFAHWLSAQGVVSGDRVAFMLEPSRAFYVAMFGAMKLGAISVPLFTHFGPEGLQLRVHEWCSWLTHHLTNWQGDAGFLQQSNCKIRQATRFSSPLHAPTLLLKWWASMPASLCFGPAGNLLCVLGNCVERLYRFWRCVVERMRSSGWYLLDPRLVSIKFKAIAVGETPEILRRLTL